MNSTSATVAGPVGIAVADARVEEGAGALLAFAVTLSRAASGTLTFQTGESSQTIEVTVLDDSHDEGEETLTLSNPLSGRVTHAEATGTIENHDPLPRALLARFGRTAAVHVVEHVEERLAAARAPGIEGRVAGRALRPGMERELALSFLSQLGASAGAHPLGGPTLEAGLAMAMAAAGTRGELVAGGAGGFALAFKADALWVGTATDGVDGPAGRLAATAAAVTRFRTGLEGARDYTLAGRLSLRPSVEVGLRHDGGDAEIGAGMDVGAGLIVSDASTGLAVDVRVRTLVMHQAEGFCERGMAVSLSYNPTPQTPLGLTARVASSWGGEATSGAEALWGRETMAGMAHGGVADGTRLDAEVGYGLPVGRRFVGTPRVGVSTSEYGRAYRLGYGLTVAQSGAMRVELGVDAHRRESPTQGGVDTGVLGRAALGW